MKKFKIKNNKTYYGSFFPEYEIRRREYGFKNRIGWENSIKHALYSTMLPNYSCDLPCNSQSLQADSNSTDNNSANSIGGVFNLEFSPDGKQLVAACEKQSIMVFDYISRKKIREIKKAHDSCVNCIKFLDSKLFASCSDDHTVALWDIRNLKKETVRLHGHDNWVKNIEYSPEDSMLVTSGFDGKILGWNINNYAAFGLQPIKLFSMQGLMRMRLTRDMKKLVICTSGGYLILINNLNLHELAKDVEDFRPCLYRLMQISNYRFGVDSRHSNLFKAKRNRIEFISDFPDGNDAEIIHSLQIHPQGWSALSRNTSSDNTSEWTTVHDIQEIEPDVIKAYEERMDQEELERTNRTKRFQQQELSQRRTRAHPESGIVLEDYGLTMDEVHMALNSSNRVTVTLRNHNLRIETINNPYAPINDSDRPGPSNASNNPTVEAGPSWVGRRSLVTNSPRRISNESESNSSSSTNSQDDDVHIHSRSRGFTTRDRQDRYAQQPDEDTDSDSEDPTVNVVQPSGFVFRTGLNNHQALLLIPNHAREESGPSKLVRNMPRLTNYIKEANKGSGFIKELCFSSDGRLICSPFDCGVRLLSFDENLCELSHNLYNNRTGKAQQLCAISTNICHTNCVLSTKFSPVDYSLVSGGLDGKIVWHQPIL